MTYSGTDQKWDLRKIAEFLVVGICTVAFLLTTFDLVATMLGPNSAGSHDFVEYWAAGQLLAHGANPYDGDAIYALERSAGFPNGALPLIMANPPSSLLLVLPLGMVSAHAGEWLWLAMLLVCLAISVRTIRSLYQIPTGPLNALAYGFAPILTCLAVGQISILLLFGLVFFLRWHRSRPLLAGTALWLCLLKPHLFVPLGVVLLIWTVRTRSYRILAGAGIALGISSGIATLLDSHVWVQYLSMMKTQRFDRIALPCVSVALRQIVYPHTTLVQLVPAGLGCAWAVWYFLKRHGEWDWVEHSSILMFVSVLVAPYSWFMDQAILIPALLAGLNATPSRTLIAAFALMNAGIEIAAIRGVILVSPFYLWTMPAWLLWFLIATRHDRRSNPLSAQSSEPGLTQVMQ